MFVESLVETKLANSETSIVYIPRGMLHDFLAKGDAVVGFHDSTDGFRPMLIGTPNCLLAADDVVVDAAPKILQMKLSFLAPLGLYSEKAFSENWAEADGTGYGRKPFGKGDARQIVSFLKGLKQKPSKFVIYCTYGKSRSKAVAHAFAHASENLFPAWEKGFGNKTVYNTLRPLLSADMFATSN